MIGFGFPNNWVAMIPLRLLLGIFEAGFFPGCVYLISTYYARYDMQKRYAVFYLIGSLASACSGILAYGIQQMHGLAGYWGWRWVSHIEVSSCWDCCTDVGSDLHHRRYRDLRHCSHWLHLLGRIPRSAQAEESVACIP